ncbi:mechanosensitive ion channel family protein, partial [Enterococcus faecalis]
ASVIKVSALQPFWNNINWDASDATLIEKSLSILFLILLFFIIQRIRKYLIDRTYANYSKRQHFSESRLKSLHTLII